MELSTVLLEILSCPVTGEKLVYDKEAKILISKKAGLAYPVINGIPLLLKAEAKKL
jgi:uncharacterized protein YbaR (Trm112 family)